VGGKGEDVFEQLHQPLLGSRPIPEILMLGFDAGCQHRQWLSAVPWLDMRPPELQVTLGGALRQRSMPDDEGAVLGRFEVLLEDLTGSD
jgi:hypothetical protein